MQIAVTSESTRAELRDDFLAFASQACSLQAEELCAAWGLPPVPVAFYKRGTILPVGTTHALVLLDEIDSPGALGYHDNIGGVVYARVLAQTPDDTSITLSHEVCEMIVDPNCNLWRGPNALEVCDAVEADYYPQAVEILGETRNVLMSDYLLPAWFDPTAAGPFDRMGRLRAPLEMTAGGYKIVRDRFGNVSNVFASGRVPGSFVRKLGNAKSRTLSRLRSAPAAA